MPQGTTLRERHPGWPMTTGKPGAVAAPEKKRRGNPHPGHRQMQALRAVIESFDTDNRGLSGTEISEKLGVNRGHAVALLNTLERRHWIIRDGFGFKGARPTAEGRAVATTGKANKPQGPGQLSQDVRDAMGPGGQKLFTKRVVPADMTGTAFPTAVVPALQFPFMPGKNSPKLGDRVQHGRWAGFPIYSLTLEERATCPRHCGNWSSCYGNGSPHAKRFRHGAALEDQIRASLWKLDADHPEGYVLRLHQLGDFYSPAYAMLWRDMLDRHPALRVFGYTAHLPGSEIGEIIRFTGFIHRQRWAVRFSGAAIKFSAHTIQRIPDQARQPEGLVCPEQRGKLKSCASCAFCWEKRDPVVFIDHALLGANADG